MFGKNRERGQPAPDFFCFGSGFGLLGYRFSFLPGKEYAQLFALTAGRRSCLERAVPAEIVRSCAWRQKKSREIFGKEILDSLYVFYLIRKNNKGHILNIVVIAIYVNRKKIKKVVDLYYVMITI